MSAECVRKGGACVDGVPESNPPGFTVSCPAGHTLPDGTTETTNGGSDLITSPMSFGCSQNPDGTTTPSLCCFPTDAGSSDTDSDA